MKIYSMGIDQNGRSTNSVVDIALAKVSDTESISAKQDGIEWRIGMRNVTSRARTNKDYESAGGPFEMHLGGPPHFTGVMSGHNEVTMQDGTSLRVSAGEFHYVRPGALHHSNLLSNVPLTMFNLLLPGHGGRHARPRV